MDFEVTITKKIGDDEIYLSHFEWEYGKELPPLPSDCQYIINKKDVMKE